MAQCASASRPRQLAAVAIAAATLAAAAACSGLAARIQRPDRHHAVASGASSRSTLVAAFGSPARAELGPASAPASGVPGVNVRAYRACLKAITSQQGNFAFPLSAYEAGYTNQAKLREAAAVGFPVLAIARSVGTHEGLAETIADAGGHEFFCSMLRFQLSYHNLPELPPIRATFLAFGLEPVTATAILSEKGPALAAVVYQDRGRLGHLSQQAPTVAVATASLGLRLTGVNVNGVRLNVGPGCHSAGILSTPGNPVAPGQVMLVGGTRFGDPFPHFGLTFEGSVAGRVSIPPFTGCVTPSGENLDPLLTASVSGPGNYVKLYQGPLCFSFHVPGQCIRAFGINTNPLFTVKHGRRFSASAPLTLSISNFSTSSGFVTVTCTGSAVSGAFHDTAGPPRGALASVRLARIRGCRGDDGSTWRVAVHGTAFFDGLEVLAGTTLGSAENLSFVLTGTGTGRSGTCRAVLNGAEFTTYTNVGSVLSLQPGGGSGNISVDKSNCPDVPASDTANGGGAGASATYNLVPGGTQISSP